MPASAAVTSPRNKSFRSLLGFPGSCLRLTGAIPPAEGGNPRVLKTTSSLGAFPLGKVLLPCFVNSTFSLMKR